jgi:hypothetical protein
VPLSNLIDEIYNCCASHRLAPIFAFKHHDVRQKIAGRKMCVVHASAERDIDSAFSTLVERAGGVVIGGDPFFASDLTATEAAIQGATTVLIYRRKQRKPKPPGLLSEKYSPKTVPAAP